VMRILSLLSENIKRIKAVEVTPQSAVVVVGGNNANGKTSLIDSIEYALSGARSIPAEPIRRGEDSARIVVDLGDIIVTRKFTADGTSLVVEGKDGARFSSPQTMLDKLVGTLSFDPLAFSRMESKAQAKALRELVGIDFSDLDAQRKHLYEERTLTNRQASQAEGAFKSARFHADAPAAEIDIAKVTNELKAAIEVNASIDEGNRNLAGMESTIAIYEREIAAAEKSLASLRDKRQEAVDCLERNRAQITAVAKLDLSPFDKQINDAQSINDKVRANAHRAALKKQFDQHVEKSSDISKQIENIDRVKSETLAEAKFPVPGLSFNEDGVLLNGLPFAQASGAEQLRTSVAMGLALNPKLKVLLVRDGSLLDESSLAILREMAEAGSAQVWLERVGNGGEVSVVIEDGMVKAKP
jgi:DNA repair exonuclease SbcCD ATPase subunit